MRVDTSGYSSSVDQAGEAAIAAERAGYDGWWAVETQTDPFVACTVAAERTERVQFGTGIAVALARNPMTVALAANDLQALSRGRFMLGLGSQVKAHVTSRYSMPWSKPAARMREFVLAIRAIWNSWATSEPLSFRGEFYKHTLMTPFFNPGPNPYGNPPIVLAGVGPLMTEAAGEVADGLICHGFSTERYVREVTLPALARGRAKAGKTLAGFEISGPSLIATGDTDAEIAEGLDAVRRQIAFYGSTPTYRAVLDLHGWGELHEELNRMVARKQWDRLPDLIDDDVLHTFAIVGTPEEVVAEIQRRYKDIVTRITLALPSQVDAQRRAGLFEALRGERAQDSISIT